MTELSFRVGVLTDGDLTREQRAAVDWLDAYDGVAVEVVSFDELANAATAVSAASAASNGRVTGSSESTPTDDSHTASCADRSTADEARSGAYPGPGVGDNTDTLYRFDVLWWHRDEPLSGSQPLADGAPVIDSYLADGGGLFLTLYALGAVDQLAVESVPPDRIEPETLTEPTGLLWRSLYADHPAVESLDGLRHPLRAHGVVPAVRYERVLPEHGEILASTVRGEREVPSEMSVVSWPAGDGGVLGVGTPVCFVDPPVASVDENPSEAAALTETRDRFVAGCLRSLVTTDPVPGRPKTAADVQRLRAKVDTAGQAGPGGRPKYHLTPPANWLNDPNGLIRWNGTYHVFYQYNPGGPFHNTIHWGHAVSDDLVTWRDEPIALAPSPDGPDRDGCWSGCAVDDDGTASLLYTGGRGRDQLPCLATTDDPALRSWDKHPDNPVIASPPADLDVLETEHWRAEFRDHNIWRADGTWYHLVGTGLQDRGGAALLYTSTTLTEWTYEGLLLAGGPDAGAVWECPELLDLGDTQLLHVSDYENVVYFLGRFDGDSFTTESTGLLDHGDFYAPQSLDDDSTAGANETAADRSLTWGWLPEARDVEAQWDAGWSGALSLPRVIDTGPDGSLRQRPAPAIADLRHTQIAADRTVSLETDDRQRLDISGDAIEITAELALDDADALELSVFETPDRAEYTPIRYERDGTLAVDRSPSSQDPRTFIDTQSMPVPPYDEPLSLRIFLDRSVIELYANERHCLTSRVYPTRGDAVGISAAAQGGRASIRSLSAWELGAAMPTPDAL